MEPFSSRTRAVTRYLLEKLDEETLDAGKMLAELLSWLPEATVSKFAEDEGYLEEEEEAEEEAEEEVEEVEEEEEEEEEETPEDDEDADVDS
jgi:hypothetical protein